MSWEDRIKQAAAIAAIEATTRERGRCLWVIDHLVEQAADAADSKILPSEGDLHVREIKVRLMRAMAYMVKQAIVAGLEPAKHGTPGHGVREGAAHSGEGASGAIFPFPHRTEES